MVQTAKLERTGRPIRRRRKNPAELVIMANPAELVVMGANPSSERSAPEMYDQFHGEPAKRTTTVHTPEPRPMTLADCGEMIDLQLLPLGAGRKWRTIDLSMRGIRLATNGAGSQLYLVGGNQKLSKGDFTRLGVDCTKDLIDLGEMVTIAYRTKKAHVDGKTSTYEHSFGHDENGNLIGLRPQVMYDRRGPQPQIYFVGGNYSVDAAGIIH